MILVWIIGAILALCIAIATYFLYIFDEEAYEKALIPVETVFTPIQSSPKPELGQKTTQECDDAEGEKPIVLRFSEVGLNDAKVVGGKGANLGELTTAGFPVPPGFCITSQAYKRYKGFDGNKEQEQELFSEILRAYNVLLSETKAKLVAVRSSATSEDSKNASFAGQLETFLGIKTDDELITHVKLCWESLESERVKSYNKHSTDVAFADISCCVVVQVMVDACVAGVMFTKNPLKAGDKNSELVVTASYGLGEAVVADLVTPDTFVVDSNGMKIVDKSLGSKEKMIKLNTGDKPGLTIELDVGNVEREKYCIDENCLTELIRVGMQIEDHYGSPQDVEWGIQDGKIFILQSRPITTLGEHHIGLNEFDDTIDENDWITTCNTQEMFPGAGTPLTMSFLKMGIDLGLQLLQVRFGVRQAISVDTRPVVWRYGKMFLNMSETLGPMVSGMIGGKLAKENGEMSILGRLNHESTLEELTSKPHLPERNIFIKLLTGMQYASVLVRALLGQYEARMEIRLKKCKATFSSGRFDNADVRVKYDIVLSLLKDYVLQWSDGVTCGSTSAGMMVGVMKLLSNAQNEMWSTELVAKTAALIKSADGEATAISSEPVRLVKVLVDNIRTTQKPAEIERICSLSVNEANSFFLSSRTIAGDMYREIMQNHGHRCVKESEFRIPEWAVEPSPIINLIQSSLKHSAKPNNKQSNKEDIDLTSLEGIPGYKQFLIKILVKLTNAGVRMRESGKSLQIKYNTEMKKAIRSIADDLHKANLLPEEDLVYFLTLEELGSLCHRTLDDDAQKQLITKAIKRRQILPSQEALTFEDLYKGAPIPVEEAEYEIVDEIGQENIRKGTPASTGIVKGPARVVKTLKEAEDLEAGEILICPITDVGWTPYFSLAIGIVTETGGMLSHGAVVAREYGLPCVVNVHKACSYFNTGDIIQLNGNKGIVRRIEHTEDS